MRDWTSRPTRVRVIGRAGAGRGTVARALRGAGLTVVGSGDSPEQADVDVYVFVETLNADDRAVLAAAVRPTVAVLNKADLAGFGAEGPMAVAAGRCRALSRATAVPTRPLSALLAVAGTDPAVLDPVLLDALGNLVVTPDAVGAPVRRRLAADLDLFGTACAASAIQSGAGAADLAALLRGLSGLDGVCDVIDRAAAEVRYRRLAAVPVTADQAVLARMDAAVLVVEAAGIDDPECRTRSDQLRRAVHWQRYAHGPTSAMHRACAMDIARGALRIWAHGD